MKETLVGSRFVIVSCFISTAKREDGGKRKGGQDSCYERKRVGKDPGVSVLIHILINLREGGIPCLLAASSALPREDPRRAIDTRGFWIGHRKTSG